jgi:hypothetical protein
MTSMESRYQFRMLGSKEAPTASWVVVSRTTGKPIMETWNPKVAATINLASYRVVPIGEWLGSINGQRA